MPRNRTAGWRTASQTETIAAVTSPADVHLSVEGAVATVRLHNPSRRNAISAAMWSRLGALALEISERREVRAVVIRGEGNVVFSGGADISGFAESRSDAATSRHYDDLVESTCGKIESILQPTVALIFGACVGAGASLASSCDLRMASEGAFFAVPAARLGLGYDPRGVARFIRVFGAAATRQLLLSADRLSAERAYALGAVHFLAPTDDCESRLSDLTARLTQNAPLTLHAAKLSLRAIESGDDALLSEAMRSCEDADASADYAEGRAAFAQRRPPEFIGR